MTRDEISAMKPGRELDALVAEKVMGIIKDDVDRRIFTQYGNGYFSTQISAAWEVVEKADIVEISKSYRENGVWYWGVCVKGIYTYAKSVPEAICKAALLTISEVGA